MDATTPYRRARRRAADARAARARVVRARTVRAAFAALLAGGVVPSGAVDAAELYRWVESDGSITFSPKRPPAGVDFDTVETGAAGSAVAPDRAAASAVSPVSPVAPAGRTKSDVGVEAAAATAAPPAPAASPSARANVSYAPPPLGAAVAGDVEGPAAGPGAASPDAGATARTAQGSGDAGGLPAADSADARRRAQCRELEKRVVSLERSLMIEMPPARMDDTVVSMARYQTSLDDHCRR